MSITVNSPFKAPPRISRTAWMREIQVGFATPLFNGIPEEDKPAVASAMYDTIVRRSHDPATWLAIGQCEHQRGTDDDSVLWRNDTRSLTNARTVRDPSLSGHKVITDAVRGTKYVKYQTVVDSLLDGLYRVDEPGYAYRKANAVSIIDHTMLWTEGDGPQYAAKMAAYMNRVIAEDTGETPMAAQIPGFKWYPADADHYQRGRTEPIRGGAQHYTAGTNSLDWLARNSTPPVSVHFLVKHEPTMNDRGWQLVRIEDTAWTTAFANPYTVAIEYEHKQGQTISDTAYAVLAQTWKDIAGYVHARNLGSIPLTRAGIRGHREWVNNPQLICPDGIDVDRIVREAQGTIPPDDWPSVPPAIPDPRTDNPFGDFWIPKQFAAPMASTPLNVTGYVMTPAHAWTNPAGEVLIVQFTERQRYELHEDGSVTLGRLGAEALGGDA